MKCTICGEEVILIPSATERTKKFGGNPQDYTRLFPRHTQCILQKNAEDVSALIARHSS